MIGSSATGKDDYRTRMLDSIRARSLGLFTPVWMIFFPLNVIFPDASILSVELREPALFGFF